MRWKLICSLVIFVSSTVLFALVMHNFEIDLEYRDYNQFNNINDQYSHIPKAVDAFVEHYRAHMWRIRNSHTLREQFTEQDRELVDYKNLKYYRTIYSLIPTELARAVFSIKGGAVEYTDNGQDVLECVGDNYKSIDAYDRANWNYILLVNLINTAMNSADKWDSYDSRKDIHFVDGVVADVYSRVVKAYNKKAKWNADCDNLLKIAKEDIKKYAGVLWFGKYLRLLKNERDAAKNIKALAKRREDDARKSSRFDDNWAQNSRLRPDRVATLLEMTNNFGLSEMTQDDLDHVRELEIQYSDESDDEIKWGISLRFRANKNDGYLDPRKYSYLQSGGYVRSVEDFWAVYQELPDNKYISYARLKHDKELGQKIRKAMQYIRCKAEEGRDVSKYKLIININSILNEIPLVFTSGDSPLWVTGEDNEDDTFPLKITDTSLGGIPDVFRWPSTYAQNAGLKERMQKTWQGRLDGYIKELEEIISAKHNGKDIKKVISEQVDNMRLE